MFFDPTTEQVILRIVYEAGGRPPREVLEEVRRLLWVDGAEVVGTTEALAQVEHSGGVVAGVSLRNELFACSAATVGAEAFEWLVAHSDAVVVVADADDLKRASVTAMRTAVAKWAQHLQPTTIRSLPPREPPPRFESRRSVEARTSTETRLRAQAAAEAEAQRRAEAEVKRRAAEERARRRTEELRRIAEDQARRNAEEKARREAEEAERRRAAEERRRAEEEERRRAEEEEERRAEEAEQRRRQAKRRAEMQAELEARWRARAEAKRAQPPVNLFVPAEPQPIAETTYSLTAPKRGQPDNAVFDALAYPAAVPVGVPDEATPQLQHYPATAVATVQSGSTSVAGELTLECAPEDMDDPSMPQSWWQGVVARVRRIMGGKEEGRVSNGEHDADDDDGQGDA